MIYLLHFSRPYHHVSHYLGTCEDGRFKERLARHLSGRGSKLLKAIAAVGIEVRLVRVWYDKGRRDERMLKRLKNNPRLCPLCQFRQGRPRLRGMR